MQNKKYDRTSLRSTRSLNLVQRGRPIKEQAYNLGAQSGFGRRNLNDWQRGELVTDNQKEALLEVGRENQAHGKTAPGKTLLSESDKSVEPPHNTQKVLAAKLNWSTGKLATLNQRINGAYAPLIARC